MNNNTREALKTFITEVESLAYAVSSVAGTIVLRDVIESAETLKKQLDKDETILSLGGDVK